MKEEKKIFTLDSKEENLIDLIHKVKYGELKIIVQDGLPIRVEELKRSIKL